MKPFTLNFKGKLLAINSPLIMGILNITPDSFFDGGKFLSEKAILGQAEKMLEEGADILDIGGMSSRPGATEIPEDEELKRVLKAVEVIIHDFPDVMLSIDTYRTGVANSALGNGAAMINDISAGRFDPLMFSVAAKHQCPLVLMHMQGTPSTMQQAPQYENITTEIFDFFSERVTAAQQAGVKDIILDPGFGFGKTAGQNYKLLKNMPIFETLRFPVLAGLSRKRMITSVLEVNPEYALNGTTAANMLALTGGAGMLRVHDVKEAREAVKIWEHYNLA